VDDQIGEMKEEDLSFPKPEVKGKGDHREPALHPKGSFGQSCKAGNRQILQMNIGFQDKAVEIIQDRR